MSSGALTCEFFPQTIPTDQSPKGTPNMARTDLPINPLCQASAGDFHSAEQGGFSTGNQPRPDEAPPDAEGMPSIDNAISTPLDCLWGHEDLPDATSTLGRFLAAAACEWTGEAFVTIEAIEEACALDRERIWQAIDDLSLRGILADYAMHNTDRGLMMACTFEVGADEHYGDDANPPDDWFDDGLICGYEYTLDGYNIETGDFSSLIVGARRARIYAKTNWRCFYCIEAPAEHLDHMHPKIRGGSNDDANMIGACRSCNIRKNDRTVEEYRAYLAHKNRLPDITHVRFWGEAVN